MRSIIAVFSKKIFFVVAVTMLGATSGFANKSAEEAAQRLYQIHNSPKVQAQIEKQLKRLKEKKYTENAESKIQMYSNSIKQRGLVEKSEPKIIKDIKSLKLTRNTS